MSVLPPSGTVGVFAFASTTPVLPLFARSMSAAKKLPLAFLISSCATVALVTVNVRPVTVGADPPLQSENVVHSTDAVKSPAPPVCTGDKLVNPERPAGTTPPDRGAIVVMVATLKLR